MSADPVLALGLPARALVRERLTKKLLLDMAAETANDRALVTRAVANATVEAILTPTTTGIAEHRDSVRRVEDIAVISIDLNGPIGKVDQARLLDLLHRSMPRPVVVLLREPNNVNAISVALTRVSQTDDSRSVVEASIAVPVTSLPPGSVQLANLNRTDLWAWLQDMAKTIASRGSRPGTNLDAARAIAERHRLDGLEAALATITRRAQNEKSLARRIALNAHARALRADIEDVRRLL